ncbi:PREDICTED: beta-1,3-galactosyltransferase 1-like [Priapulus caudatus]|uniref:Hexosyltransferase n=1 Tax=Priapulus caudatus TaxID=37621 RepID=A0ABM1DNM4_PRICU|nr:PREDICTED: beta-1,3-galactosyltransferase 1-like [Priapulus caudatus]
MMSRGKHKRWMMAMGSRCGLPLPLVLLIVTSFLIYIVQLPYMMHSSRSTRQLLSIELRNVRARRSARWIGAIPVSIRNTSYDTPKMALSSPANSSSGAAPSKMQTSPVKITSLYANVARRQGASQSSTRAPPSQDAGDGFSIDGHTYPFILTAEHACGGGATGARLEFVTMIISGSANFLDRKTVRETWAKPRDNGRFLFLLGRPKDEKTQARIVEESAAHGDLVQADFGDTYRNLTLKTVMGLRWASRYCGNARYLFKTDDDTFAHMNNILRYLRKIGTRSRYVSCRANDDHRPERDVESKWYVPESLFNETFYPVYCSGAGYILSMDVVSALYEAATRTPSIPVEDAYVTGILTRAIGVVPRMNLAFGYEKEVDGINVPSLRQAFQWIFTYTGHASDGVVRFQHTMLNLMNFRQHGGSGGISLMPFRKL